MTCLLCWVEEGNWSSRPKYHNVSKVQYPFPTPNTHLILLRLESSQSCKLKGLSTWDYWIFMFWSIEHTWEGNNVEFLCSGPQGPLVSPQIPKISPQYPKLSPNSQILNINGSKGGVPGPDAPKMQALPEWGGVWPLPGFLWRICPHALGALKGDHSSPRSDNFQTKNSFKVQQQSISVYRN